MKIVAVTACPTGIAHTYMAKAGLEASAKKLGHDIKVETQGGMGIENELTKADVEGADAVVLAVGVTIEGMERFKGKKVLKVGVKDAITKADLIFKKIEESLKA